VSSCDQINHAIVDKKGLICGTGGLYILRYTGSVPMDYQRRVDRNVAISAVRWRCCGANSCGGQGDTNPLTA
jgi:hypothetical protein